MSESQEHRKLVETIVEFVNYQYPFLEKGEYFIDNGVGERPPGMSDSSIPDFYCESKGYLIIGEAKTKDDIVNDHSESSSNLIWNVPKLPT